MLLCNRPWFPHCLKDVQAAGGAAPWAFLEATLHCDRVRTAQGVGLMDSLGFHRVWPTQDNWLKKILVYWNLQYGFHGDFVGIFREWYETYVMNTIHITYLIWDVCVSENWMYSQFMTSFEWENASCHQWMEWEAWHPDPFEHGPKRWLIRCAAFLVAFPS